MKINKVFSIFLLCTGVAYAADYQGRVVDIDGRGIGYATVYPEEDPVAGAATNDQGFFHFSTDLSDTSTVVVSFIGYEKQVLPLRVFTPCDSAVVVLREQPIALEETVVAAKANKQRNKRKQMAALLHQVYVRMQEDFSDEPSKYHVVSDARLDSEGEAWGMEQMIASVVVLPEARKNNKDSVQFAGEYCKRFFDPTIRKRVDTVFATRTLEKYDPRMRIAANSVDSGVVVHRMLFDMGNIKYDFEHFVDDIRNWTVSNENEGETVLTHVEKKNYFGIVRYAITRHYILDSKTLSVRRFSEHSDLYLNVPFGKKLDADMLKILNIFNMGDEQIERFRLRKMNAHIDFNTIYQWRGGHIYILEKNMDCDATIIGSRQMEIPIKALATQRVTALQTEGVQPLQKDQITRRVKREIVEIY